MVRSIKFSWASSPYTLERDHGIRLRIEITCTTGLDTKLFAYRMLPTAYNDTRGVFSHVCSPVDLEDYPADNPLVGVAPEWFRLDFVDVLLRSTTEATNLLNAVREDLRTLVATLERMDTLMPTGTGLCGPDCDPPEDPDDPDPPEPGPSLTFGEVTYAEAFGTTEQNVGNGVSWVNIGDGAGSPSSTPDLGSNSSRVELQPFAASKLLLVQGFDFSGIPDDASIEGIEVSVYLRDATAGSVPDDNALGSNTSSVSLSDTAPRLMFLALQSPELGSSDNLSNSTDIDGPNWTAVTRGDDTNLWGLAVVPASSIKDGAFGIGLTVQADTAAANIVVDKVHVTVFYREVV